MKVDKDFIQDFIKAEKTFLHQIVFDILLVVIFLILFCYFRTRKHIPLYPYLEAESEENKYLFAGKVCFYLFFNKVLIRNFQPKKLYDEL